MSLSIPQDKDDVRRAEAIVRALRSPGGCPWDREQTHQSLIPNLLEEAYEVADAIQSGSHEDIREELGDLLLQVLLHAQISSDSASPDKAFNLDEVAQELSEKLIRRHPHVFGNATLAGTDEVLRQWDQIKQQEKARQGGAAEDGKSASLRQAEEWMKVGRGQPSLTRAAKIQKKVSKIGFDWSDPLPVIEKIREELAEVEEAIASGQQADVFEELGDLLFSVVNLARQCQQDPESALAASNEKFSRRFLKLTAWLDARGISLEEASQAQLEEAWEAIKTSSPESLT